MEGDGAENSKSFSGIPEAVFVDNVDEFMNLPENSGGVDKVLRQLDEQHGKYKFMEYTLNTKRRRLRQQIPDLARSLDVIEKLKTQEEDLDTQFLLSDQVFLKANIMPTKTVYLWLGANVMLEYSLEDAEKLLTTNMATAKKNLSCVEHDLDFLRDQWTTTEVNMARVYNWDVKKRQAAKASS
ncbi:prefoldin subunit 3 [Vanessa tameamea]|uniref:Prefoldin subunit 3 n=1 Tax=Vanessa tameamea TaxID=334116 RepID=A0A8B8IQ80_VANTA|nr:prefoldin subunit 3 [Vanessa tameamea]XP_026498637.1 prefoldin subunit 3 [Vanessa tameamea]XP_046977693.1 prefoldin subunit 3 [Vanessa cardui]XP_046977694.1 prefoldin subunit 3 [Vanessa cardui]XP_047531062.1 prefoldin subunit 3 [Vanessa atalanta]